MEGMAERPFPPVGARGGKRPSGKCGRPETAGSPEPLGSRNKGDPGVFALKTRPGNRRRAWNGPTPKGGIFTSIIRPIERVTGP